MAQIIFNIENEKTHRVENALARLYPIPQIDMKPEFTKAEWVKECTRRWMIRQVARSEQKTAIDAIVYQEEDDLIT